MNDLFSDHTDSITLPPGNGDFELWPNWLSTDEADQLFLSLSDTLDWQTEEIWMFGRMVTVPRLIAWYGDEGSDYSYSGVTHSPLPWTQELYELKNRLAQQFEHAPNSVLANLYRDGNDSMGWHSDDEKELGASPTIFSVNLGASRYFDYRRKSDHSAKQRVELSHGSLLIMQGAAQLEWQHQVPKQKRIAEPRINLTFRTVFPSF